jgi:hypothetical protein
MEREELIIFASDSANSVSNIVLTLTLDIYFLYYCVLGSMCSNLPTTINEVSFAEKGVAKSVSDISQPLIRVVHLVLVNKVPVTETHRLMWRHCVMRIISAGKLVLYEVS